MTNDILSLRQTALRGADSNSLLRMYDDARGSAASARSQQERARAERAVERIARELGRRNVRCELRPRPATPEGSSGPPPALTGK
jgi:hypothetical protein